MSRSDIAQHLPVRLVPAQPTSRIAAINRNVVVSTAVTPLQATSQLRTVVFCNKTAEQPPPPQLPQPHRHPASRC